MTERRTEVRETVDSPVEPVGLSIWALLARILTVLFGILQVLLIVRIVLLLLGADQANEIVKDVLNLTNPFIEPFRGIFRIDNLSSTTGSVLDIAAIVALVGWTILEGIVLAIVRIPDRWA